MPSLIQRCLFALVLAMASFAGHAAVSDSQTAWRLLDYIAVDYPEAVADGEVVNEFEYAEMLEFSTSAGELINGLEPTPAQSQLLEQVHGLQAAIEGKRPPAEVGAMARGAAAALLAAYPMPLAPASAPDLARGAQLYQQLCASCHGASGGGDGPASVGLDPPAIDFTDEDRARERSIFALYQVIEQGLEGTSMLSYASLPEDERWALSFHIGQYAFPEELAAQGRALWEDDAALRAQFPDLAALTQVTPAALAAQVGEDDARALTAFLRRDPGAVDAVAEPEGALALARMRVAEVVAAYGAGDNKTARDLALSAYLDGFEPVEPVLAARDRPLMLQIEAAMIELRTAISRSAPPAEVSERATAINTLLGEAEAALAPGQANGVSSFVGAFTILLREGLEALLIVIAMIAFLRKAGRTEAMPYVHAGWAGALVAGGATWAAATWLISISGASRELTEGFAALFAAVVLVWVGIWMHGKSQAGAWQRYINERLSHALSKGSMWFLFLLSFIVVYREAFETVLFYAALWSQGAHGAVMAGAAAAVVVLAVIAWAMLRWSRKLPFGTFFAISSALLAILAVVLAGKGVAALQEAGWMSLSPVAFPRIDLLGISPTWETLGAQVLVIAVLAIGFMANKARNEGKGTRNG
ncbi:cytochrome c/FTR1 family iron permease [Lysobacter sp. GX 14042]|uniref:cytochrome c/FTR1 family iron permease n=1 Tax=Lysobacter sp. GX 14042 TaxID=2907155 RepID=UPI001F437234|nr:cytochrome c/FTR1 family iron permease [Lysobacter sp. GX 14042]MCE7032856.1 cytochrome c/FTR1 family iron permease [Lysobacter sp. GX 14042]